MTHNKSALEFAEAAPVSHSQLPPGRAYALGFAFVRLPLLALLSLVQPCAQALEFEANIIESFLVAQDVKAGDMNRDGKIDFVISNTDGIFWFPQARFPGAPWLATAWERYAVSFHPGGSIEEIQLIDIDADGDLDVLSASSSFGANKIAWYANNGRGGFSQPSVISVSTQSGGVSSVHAADLDGDGDLDVLAAFYPGNVEWYANNGKGGFSKPSVIDEVDPAESVHVVDLDADGDIDLLSASYPNNDDGKIAWYANDGSGRFSQPSFISTKSGYARSMHVADLDGDGDLDVLAGSDTKTAWYANDGGGRFSQPSVITTQVRFANFVHAADLDGDGDLDVLSASDEDGKLALYSNDGSGGFSESSVISTQTRYAPSLYAADIDGDGDLDLVAGWVNKIALYANDGSGRFSQPSNIFTQVYGAETAYAADLDGDGDLDLVAGGQHKIAWYANDGSGRFSQPSVITTHVRIANSVHAADLDGDGDLDVLSATSGYTIEWYANDGSGGFSQPSVISTPAWVFAHAADLDGDGDLDVLSATSGSPIAWYANDGSGGFSQPSVISTQASNVRSVHAADLDGDGDLDVLAASFLDGKIAWYRNNLITAPGGEPWKNDPNGDINGDGISNLMAYAFPLNSPARAPYSPEATLLVAGPNQPRTLLVTYLRRVDAAASGLSYTAEFSSSLETGWQSAESTKVEAVDATWERVTVEDVALAAGTRSRYTRVIVKLN